MRCRHSAPRPPPPPPPPKPPIATISPSVSPEMISILSKLLTPVTIGCGRPGCPSSPTILTIFLPRISRTASAGRVRISILLTAEIWTPAFMPGLRNGIFASSASAASGCVGASAIGTSSKNPPKSPPKLSSSVSSSFATGCSCVGCAGVSWVVGLDLSPAPPPSA